MGWPNTDKLDNFQALRTKRKKSVEQHPNSDNQDMATAARDNIARRIQTIPGITHGAASNSAQTRLQHGASKPLTHINPHWHGPFSHS